MAKEVTIKFADSPTQGPEVIFEGDSWTGRNIVIAQNALARAYKLQVKKQLNQEAKNGNRYEGRASERGAGNPRSNTPSGTEVVGVGNRTPEVGKPSEREDSETRVTSVPDEGNN